MFFKFSKALLAMMILMGVAAFAHANHAEFEFGDEAGPREGEPSIKDTIADYARRYQTILKRHSDVKKEYDRQKEAGLNPEQKLGHALDVMGLFVYANLVSLAERYQELEKEVRVEFDRAAEVRQLVSAEKFDALVNYIDERLTLNKDPIVEGHRLSINEQKLEAIKRSRVSYKAEWRDAWIIPFDRLDEARRIGGQSVVAAAAARDFLIETRVDEGKASVLTQDFFDGEIDTLADLKGKH